MLQSSWYSMVTTVIVLLLLTVCTPTTSSSTTRGQSRVNSVLTILVEGGISVIFFNLGLHSVASLGWVTPGAATGGVKLSPLYFFPKNLATFFLLIAVAITITSYGQTRPNFLPVPVRPRFSTILCKFAHKFFSFGCHPLEGVTRGDPPPTP